MSLQRSKKVQKDLSLAGTVTLMGALGRMPPKPHEDMKLGKSKRKKKVSPKRRAHSGEPD